MYTAERFKAGAGDEGDLLAHEAFLSRARAEHDQGRPDAARIALGAYALARVLDLCLPLESAAPTIAGQIGTPISNLRRRLDTLPTGETEVAHLRGIVAGLEADSSARRAAEVRASTLAYAYFLEHEGRLAEALDVVHMAVRTWPGDIPLGEFGTLALHVARLNRLMARWAHANEAYGAAEEAGRACGDRIIALRGRLGRGAVLRGQGNLPASREIARSVIAEAQGAELRHIQAGAYADLGVVYMLMERRIDALVAMYEAFLRTVDPMQRMRVLGDLGVGLAELGAEPTARVAFGIVLASSTSALLRMNARLELMALDAAAGNRVAFEQHRQAARDFATQMTPSMACDYRYKAARGLALFDQTGRARALVVEALRIAETHGLNEWYFRLERALGELSATAATQPAPVAAAAVPTKLVDPGKEPALARLASGLREFAEATGGRY